MEGAGAVQGRLGHHPAYSRRAQSCDGRCRMGGRAQPHRAVRHLRGHCHERRPRRHAGAECGERARGAEQPLLTRLPRAARRQGAGA